MRAFRALRHQSKAYRPARAPAAIQRLRTAANQGKEGNVPALRPVTPARRPWPPRERDVPPCRNVGIDANAFLFIANIVMKIAAQQLFFLPFQTGHRRKSRGCVPACMQPKQRRGSEYYHTYSAVHFTLCRSIEPPNKRVGRRFFVLEKAGQRLQAADAYRPL